MYLLTALMFWPLALAAQPATPCRLALVLGLDVSGSVDKYEYRLQLDGVAGALTAPQVQRQILQNPHAPIWLMVFEWAGIGYQRDLVAWTALRKAGDLSRVAGILRAQSRDPLRNPLTTSTALGHAMRYGGQKLAEQPFCWQKTLDVSGDGTNNEGPEPEALRHGATFSGITINGLVIGPDTARGREAQQMEIMALSAYYRRRVIRGSGAFIKIAKGFEDFERAMIAKLLRETEKMILGRH